MYLGILKNQIWWWGLKGTIRGCIHGEISLCIGDSYYTGFVGADDFIKFSDYNFTGRNMKREQKLQKLNG